jgi:hypothetical protein
MRGTPPHERCVTEGYLTRESGQEIQAEPDDREPGKIGYVTRGIDEPEVREQYEDREK